MQIALWILSSLLIVVGLAGTILPALPGTVFVVAGVIVGAWIDDFTRVSVTTVVVITILGVISFAIEYIAGAMGARRVGASREAVIGAAIGTFVGLFFGIPGVVFGPFIGAVLGELVAQRSLGQAGRAGVATWIGFVLGTGVKLVLAFAMLGIFAFAYIF